MGIDNQRVKSKYNQEETQQQKRKKSIANKPKLKAFQKKFR